MKRSIIAAATLALIASLFVFLVPSLAAADNDPKVPVMRELNPFTAKAGDQIEVTGENLNAQRVTAVYLTRGETEVQVKVLSQADTKLKFVVPQVDPGTYRPAVVMADDNRLIEQPVVLFVK